MYGTLETVKDKGLAVRFHFDRFVVNISTYCAALHDIPSEDSGVSAYFKEV